MESLTGRLAKLVGALDALGKAPTLVELSQAVEAAALSPADVAPFVHENAQHYNRALVVIRDQYELLIMTWLPGQASAPHDHAGSVCAMQVLQGEVVEGSYRVAHDGYVELEYETHLSAGQTTAGQDAGIHTIRNPSLTGETLVTLHVYSPPLSEFRRFVARPVRIEQVEQEAWTPPSVVVVGGGFCGTMTAAQLLRNANAASRRLRVAVVERRGAIGEGLAYGTRDPAHLLNVPAGRMSAWPDRPDDFIRWAQSRVPGAKPSEFLPRQLYGEYVREQLLSAARDAQPTAELSVQFDEVRRVARHPNGGWMVHLGRGDSLRADAVVLSVGHRPPADPIAHRWQGPRSRFISDPWRAFAMNAVAPDDEVVILGTGLTAVDTLLSLEELGHRAPVTLLSRNGRTPLAHAREPAAPIDLEGIMTRELSTPGGVKARSLFRALRRLVAEVGASGVDWRRVVDGFRPHTAAVWRAMPLAERARFLRHARGLWEVHRHRMAAGVADRFEVLRASGRLRIIAGRTLRAEADADGVWIVAHDRRADQTCELRCAWVINCTGPVPSNSAAANPAIGSLLVDGWLRADELDLGIETDAEGHAIDKDGRVTPDLFVVGTLCKPLYWESTAVPELRQQAATVAQRAFRTVCEAVAEWAI